MRQCLIGGTMGLALASLFVGVASFRAGDYVLATITAAFIIACFYVCSKLDGSEETIADEPVVRTFTVRHRSKPEVRVFEHAE